MMTLRDVKAALPKLGDFCNRVLFLEPPADKTPSSLVKYAERLVGVIIAQEQLNKSAAQLFLEIYRQVWEDNGIEWGSQPDGHLTDSTGVSSEAEKRLNTFLEFVANN